MAIMFHEVWKPATYDESLHNRMGVSYATNAFHIVRAALRREMLLALMRLWDKRREAVRMKSAAEILGDKDVIVSKIHSALSRFSLTKAIILSADIVRVLPDFGS